MPKDVPHLVKAEIEEYLALEEKRKAANRQADDIEKQAKVLKARIEAFIVAKGGSARTVERSGYVLSIKQKAGSVAWKEEFLRVAGQEEAARLSAAAPKRDYLSVEPATANRQ